MVRLDSAVRISHAPRGEHNTAYHAAKDGSGRQTVVVAPEYKKPKLGIRLAVDIKGDIVPLGLVLKLMSCFYP